MAKISTYPISSSTDGANLLGSDLSGATSQFAYPSSSSTTMLSQEIRNMLLEESRPVRLVAKKTSSGLTNSGNSSAGEIVIEPGRAVYIESIVVSTDVSGMLFGFFTRSKNSAWIPSSLEDEFQIATTGGAVVIPVGAIYGELFRISLSFTPSPAASTPYDPNLGIKIMGIEFTNDLNFSANKRLLYAGDSISWSLMGDWRPHNQSQNLNYSSEDFPENFGNQLASFRLIHALRSSKSEDIRLVNKGFGGSSMVEDQWFALNNGLYSFDWNMFILQAGVNDAKQPQTPLRQLTFIERAKDHVRYRDNRGRSNYPIVYCTAPSVDDKTSGTGSRNNIDSRIPLLGNSESYYATFDSDLSDPITLETSDNKPLKVDGGNTGGGLAVSGGVEGTVYRVDFWTATTLKTSSVTNTSAPEAYVRLLNHLSIDSADAPNDGLISVPAKTTLYLLCVQPNKEYHEIDRASLLGTELSGSTFDPINSHYIAKNFSSATAITGPDLSSVAEQANITAISKSLNTVVLNLDPGILSAGLPDASVIDTNDVWVRISGIVDTQAVEVDYESLNGFQKVIGYTTSGDNLVTITVLFDARNSAVPEDYRLFRNNNLNLTTARAEILKLRDVIVEFEGTSSSTASNCATFSNGSTLIDSGNYLCNIQLKSGSTFNLTSGKGIAFGFYQEGNVIYMNEIQSGDITNAGYILGSDSYDNFYSQTETGSSKLKIVNNMITTVVDAYGSDNCVYMVDLEDVTDVKGVTQTSAGRIKYPQTRTASLDPESGTLMYQKVGDLIEDPVFKQVGNSGTNECVVGERVHRSPKGHELLFNRLWAKIQTITIPS